MSVAKDFLDRSADFFMFVLGCAYAISGFANTARVQNVLNDSIGDKGTVVVADAYPDISVSGEKVIALLLMPEGVESVDIDGRVFSSSLEQGIIYIDTDGKYLLTRKTGTGGSILTVTTVTE